MNILPTNEIGLIVLLFATGFMLGRDWRLTKQTEGMRNPPLTFFRWLSEFKNIFKD